jgi:transposase
MPAPKGFGRPRVHDLREILNAVFYLLKSGCQWRLLPHDFPRWPTVYHYFRKWRIEKAPGRGSTEPSENASGFAWAEILNPARAWWTASRSRAPGWAENSAVTTGVRRSRAESVICWWTPRVSC